MNKADLNLKPSAEDLNLAERKKHQRYGRRVWLIIGLIGLGLLLAFNWNFHLQLTGNKYQAEIISVEKRIEEEYLVTIEFRKEDGLLHQKSFTDETQMASFDTYKKGDDLDIWFSKKSDDIYYVSRLHVVTKLFILGAFVLVPFAFAIWGKVE